MNAPAFSFDLLTEPWIPCTLPNGTTEELGLHETLARAHEVVSVGDDSPLVTFALHRLLLVVLHRVVDGPRGKAAWREVWQRGRVDEVALSAYLSKWEDRFNLFSPDYPFFQVAGLTQINKLKIAQPPAPVARLALERTSGNNAVLFDHSIDDAPHGWPAPLAARQLLTAQAFALGGGQGPTTNIFGKHPYSSNAPLVGAWCTLLMRRCLFETLVANLLDLESPRLPRSSLEDAPVWERDSHRPPGANLPLGPLDYLTFPARYVRLVPEQTEEGTCVRRAYVASGLSLDQSDGQVSVLNPFASYRSDPKLGNVAVGFRQDRAAWRDSAALFALAPKSMEDLRPLALQQAANRHVRAALGEGALLNVTCFGLATEVGKQAKPTAWRRDAVPAPIQLLIDEDLVRTVVEALKLADDCGNALRKAFTQLAANCLETEQKSADAKAVSSLRRRMTRGGNYWGQLESPFRVFMHGLARDPEVAATAFVQEIRKAAKHAFAHASRQALGPLARRERAVVLAHRLLWRRLGDLLPPQNPPQNPTLAATELEA